MIAVPAIWATANTVIAGRRPNMSARAPLAITGSEKPK